MKPGRGPAKNTVEEAETARFVSWESTSSRVSGSNRFGWLARFVGLGTPPIPSPSSTGLSRRVLDSGPVGAWRSLVAHLNGVQEAERSNRSAPTNFSSTNEAPGNVPRASSLGALPPSIHPKAIRRLTRGGSGSSPSGRRTRDRAVAGADRSPKVAQSSTQERESRQGGFAVTAQCSRPRASSGRIGMSRRRHRFPPRERSTGADAAVVVDIQPQSIDPEVAPHGRAIRECDRRSLPRPHIK